MTACNNKISDIWFGLVALFNFTYKYTAAIKAYGVVFGDNASNNAYIDTAQEAIWRQMLSELSKIYDRKATCGADNCSMSHLRDTCKELPISPETII